MESVVTDSIKTELVTSKMFLIIMGFVARGRQ